MAYTVQPVRFTHVRLWRTAIISFSTQAVLPESQRETLAADGVSLCSAGALRNISRASLNILLYPRPGALSIPALLLFPVILRFGIDNLAPVEIAPVQGRDDRFRRRDVGRNRHIMQIAHSDQIDFQLICDRVAQRFLARIPEIQYNIDFIVSDSGRDLLNAALRAWQEPFDLQSAGFRNIFSRR